MEAQRSRERLEQMADRIAAIAHGNLAESTERLGAGLVTPGDLVFQLTPNSLDASPSGQLLYYPFPPPDPEIDSNLFAEGNCLSWSSHNRRRPWRLSTV